MTNDVNDSLAGMWLVVNEAGKAWIGRPPDPTVRAEELEGKRVRLRDAFTWQIYLAGPNAPPTTNVWPIEAGHGHAFLPMRSVTVRVAAARRLLDLPAGEHETVRGQIRAARALRERLGAEAAGIEVVPSLREIERGV